MSRFPIRVGAVLVACSISTGCGPVAEPVVIEDVTVIDARGPIEGQTVVLEGSEIVSVASASEVEVPRGSQRVDGRGKYLIPGLTDLHTHLSKARSPALSMLLYYGITTVRDMGGDWDELRVWREGIRSGELAGPRIIGAGPYLEAPSNVERMRNLRGQDRMVEPVERTRISVETPERARQLVDSLSSEDVDWIKFRTLASSEVFDALAEATDSLGLPMAGHAFALPLQDLSAGRLESVEHFLFPTHDDLAERGRRRAWREMAENGVVIVPTLVGWARATLAPDSLLEAVVADSLGIHHPDRRYISRYLLLDWREQLEERLESGDEGIEWTAIYESTLRNLREMKEEGVAVLPGTDLAVLNIFPGLALHQELVLMVEKLGMTPGEALTAATLGSTRALGLADSVGVVAPGMKADLVLLDADPLVDIRNTRAVHSVIRDGAVYGPAGRERLLESARTSPARMHNDWR